MNGLWFLWYANGQTDRQAHCNTPHSPRGQNNKKQRNVGRSNQIFWGGGLGVTQFLRFFQFRLLFSLFRLKKIRISCTPANFLRPAIASRVRCAVVEIPLRSHASVKRTGELCSSQSANELQTAGLTLVQVLRRVPKCSAADELSQCRLYLHWGPGHPQPNGAPR